MLRGHLAAVVDAQQLGPLLYPGLEVLQGVANLGLVEVGQNQKPWPVRHAR